ncbi:hypothetical protein DFQ28_005039 [Apophysomyces sp. BC1034]|nr:hypothetical protein DFQ29_000468 [Apophysomyces sp. BC1021]KAG0194826.1 hypothetical protein DFQ28_005039 [Apophysomyces sp. BC1034]
MPKLTHSRYSPVARHTPYNGVERFPGPEAGHSSGDSESSVIVSSAKSASPSTDEAQSFQFNAKSLVATHSQANVLTREQIRDFFLSLGCDTYLVAQESHQDGNKHFHVYITWKTPFRTRDARRFDLSHVHPNLARPISPTPEGKQNGVRPERKRNAQSKWRRAIEESTTSDEFYDFLKRELPRDYILNFKELQDFAQHHFH